MVDAHEANGKAGGLFAGQAWLVEADDPLPAFAGSQQQDLRATVVDGYLVGGNERQAAPGEELGAE